MSWIRFQMFHVHLHRHGHRAIQFIQISKTTYGYTVEVTTVLYWNSTFFNDPFEQSPNKCPECEAFCALSISSKGTFDSTSTKNHHIHSRHPVLPRGTYTVNGEYRWWIKPWRNTPVIFVVLAEISLFSGSDFLADYRRLEPAPCSPTDC